MIIGPVISIKRLLNSDNQDASPKARLAWLILEAVSCHAIELDAVDKQAFQDSLREVVSKLEQSSNDARSLVLVGEAIRSIELYNRGVQRSVNSHIKELQSIGALFTRSLLQVSKSSVGSATKLRQIEHQIEKASQSDDLRALKTQLEHSLGAICEEAIEQGRRSDEITAQIRDSMSRPESAAILSEAIADLDLTTGLPNFRAGELAIRASIAAESNTYAVLLRVERIEAINSRFGPAVGDHILMFFGQHLAQRLANGDRLFRWRGPTFLVLMDRTGPEMSVRAEMARLASSRLEQEVELGGRSVLLPVASSWSLTGTLGCTADTILRKLEAFSNAGVTRTDPGKG